MVQWIRQQLRQQCDLGFKVRVWRWYGAAWWESGVEITGSFGFYFLIVFDLFPFEMKQTTKYVWSNPQRIITVESECAI